MSNLVDVNLEILKKTAYKSLLVIWIGIEISMILPFVIRISYLSIILSSIVSGIIIIVGSYYLLISLRFKRTKETSFSFNVILTKRGELLIEEENMAKNDNMKVTLSDVGLRIDKRWLTISLSFIGLSVVAANLLSYWLYEILWIPLLGVLIGSVTGASIGILGNYWLLKSNRIIKHIEGTLHENITLKDKILVEKFDKDGNLVEERREI